MQGGVRLFFRRIRVGGAAGSICLENLVGFQLTGAPQSADVVPVLYHFPINGEVDASLIIHFLNCMLSSLK